MEGHEGAFARCHDRPMPRFNNRRSLFALRGAAAFFLLQRLLGLLFILLVACGAVVFRMDDTATPAGALVQNGAKSP